MIWSEGGFSGGGKKKIVLERSANNVVNLIIPGTIEVVRGRE